MVKFETSLNALGEVKTKVWRISSEDAPRWPNSYVMSRVHLENFSKLRIGLEHVTCHTEQTVGPTDDMRGRMVWWSCVGLLTHGLWVRDWLCSTGEKFPTVLPRRSGQCPTAIDAASTGCLLSAMLRLVRVREPDGTDPQKENDRSLKPVLRLQVTNAHGRITSAATVH